MSNAVTTLNEFLKEIRYWDYYPFNLKHNILKYNNIIILELD
jgi:hypothetical protein